MRSSGSIGTVTLPISFVDQSALSSPCRTVCDGSLSIEQSNRYMSSNDVEPMMRASFATWSPARRTCSLGKQRLRQTREAAVMLGLDGVLQRTQQHPDPRRHVARPILYTPAPTSPTATA